MNDLSGIGAYANSRGVEGSKSAAAGSGGSSAQGTLGITDFYKLLATQLQYQDADNPMDTSEMMNQLVQTQMIEAITQMSTTNTITYATSMVGKNVTMAEVDSQGRFTGEETKGTITGILMGDNPILFMNGKAYHMAQIMTVGDVPEDALHPPKPDDSDDPVEPPVDPPEGGDSDNSSAA